MKEILNRIAKDKFGDEIDNYFIPRKSTNNVFVVDIKDKKYCIKISSTPYTAAFRAEPLIQERIFKETSIPVPEVIEIDYSRETVRKDFFIMEYHEGKNAEDYDFSNIGNSFVKNMIEEYLKLSNISFNKFGYFHWSDSGGLEVFPAYNEWSVMLNNEVNIMTENMKSSRFRYLADYHKRFYKNEKEILESYNKVPKIVNSDYRLANILIKNGELSSILDWGSCFCGDLRFGLKKMEFLIYNPTTDYDISSNENIGEKKIMKFYESLIWMYIMSGFDSWFSECSEIVKGKYEQKIRDSYKKTIEEYKSI